MFSYEGSTYTNADTMIQSGTTLATQGSILFRQSCDSMFSDGISYHLYQDKWVVSERPFPSSDLISWLTDIEAGRGSKKRASLSNIQLPGPETEPLPDNLQHIRIPYGQYQLAAWCNAYFDSLFPVDWAQFQTADIDLYFDSTENRLLALTFTVETTTSSLEGAARICYGHEYSMPVPDYPIWETEVSEDTLSSQWSVYTQPGEMDLNDCIWPDAAILEEMKAEYHQSGKLRLHIDGHDLVLPCPAHDLLNAGFAFSDSPDIEPGHPAALRLQSLNGSITVIARNNTDSPIRPEDAEISGIYLSQEEIGSISAALPGGVTLDTSPDYLTQIWTPVDAKAGYYQLTDTCYAEVYTTSGQVYCIGIIIESKEENNETQPIQ